MVDVLYCEALLKRLRRAAKTIKFTVSFIDREFPRGDHTLMNAHASDLKTLPAPSWVRLVFISITLIEQRGHAP